MVETYETDSSLNPAKQIPRSNITQKPQNTKKSYYQSKVSYYEKTARMPFKKIKMFRGGFFSAGHTDGLKVISRKKGGTAIPFLKGII